MDTPTSNIDNSYVVPVLLIVHNIFQTFYHLNRRKSRIFFMALSKFLNNGTEDGSFVPSVDMDKVHLLVIYTCNGYFRFQWVTV